MVETTGVTKTLRTTVVTVDFLPDGNAVVIWASGVTELMPSGDVPELLLRKERERRERENDVRV